MDVSASLGIALTIVAIVLALVAMYALYVIIKAVRETSTAVTEIRDRLIPLLEKADVTVDAVNVEILRLDAIVAQAEEVGDAVSTASGFIKSPVNSAAYGIARIVRAFGKR